MAEIGATEVGATRQDLVAGLVQEVLKQKSILMPTVTDYSRFAVPGSKSVLIPKRTQFSAADKAENTNLSAQEITFTGDTINFDKHKAIYAKLEDIAGLQSNVDVRSEIIREMAAELALQVDKDIIVELKQVSAAGPDHLLDYADTVGDTIALTDISEARRLLKNQKLTFMDDNYYMVISPDKEKEMLDIDNFISVEKYGSREALLNGEIGRVFGFKVLCHTELTATEALFYHSSHVGMAMQANPSFETDRDLAAVSEEFLLNQIYGMSVLDSGVRGVFYNGSGA